MNVSDLLDESRVLIKPEGSASKEAILRELTQAALGEAAVDEVVAQLLAREGKVSTGIGLGVAIPHARTAHAREPMGAVAVSRSGVEFGSVDGEPAHIIFELLTPEEDARAHVNTLAAVVTFFGDVFARERILEAKSAAEVLEIFRGAGGG